jgi:transposase-like protein
MKHFSDEETAREYLEAIRWPNGVVCPHCKNNEAKQIWKIRANEAKKVRAGLYQCGKCDKQFTVTVGTIFEDSHIPLSKWLVAWYLVSSSKKGISALQIQRSLGLGSYRTAWMMMHKIRHAMKDPAISEPLDGTLEADETYVGGKPGRGFGSPKIRKGFRVGSNKTPVIALVQRGGKVAGLMAAAIMKNRPVQIIENSPASSISMDNEVLAVMHGLAVCAEGSPAKDIIKIVEQPAFRVWFHNFVHLLHDQPSHTEGFVGIFEAFSVAHFPENLKVK